MLTKKQEAQFLEQLDKQADVQDVYFCKGVLYVINGYDIPHLEKFLDDTPWGLSVTYRYVEEDQYA